MNSQLLKGCLSNVRKTVCGSSYLFGSSYDVDVPIAKKHSMRFTAGTLGTLLLLSFSIPAVLAEDQLTALAGDESPKVTVYVGVRDDAKPFSYIDITRKSERIIPGYSGYSVEVCRHVLKQMKNMRKYRNFEFKAGNIKATNRFKELGSNGKLFMLCGPDSITKDRLADYLASQPFFLSGMTYAYLNPRSPKFPRGAYCGNIIGVVRSTTADTEGLPDIAARGLLMRFDKALNLELSKTSERIAKSRRVLRDLINREISDEKVKLLTYDLLPNQHDLTKVAMEKRLADFQPIVNENLVDLFNALDDLADNGNGLARKVRSLMNKQHGILNKEVARSITTEECPLGFSSLPVRKYENHDDGVEKFCNGEVLYYLADYDILKNKTQEISDCDVVMNRFTRSREVYGAFFSKDHLFVANANASSDAKLDSDSGESGKTKIINAAGFYADFNNILTRSMQKKSSDIEEIFSAEFGNQEMSDELASFFDGFKME